jgi:hypothetical protein
MKKFLYLAISTMLSTLLTTHICLGVPDSCLTLIWPDIPPNSYNPDNVMKDTCKDSPTYGEWYARGIWIVRMEDYIFNYLIPKTHRAYLEDIDSVKYPLQKEAYKNMENKFGEISFFRDPYDCDNRYDTEFIKYPCLEVEFSSYGRIKEIRDSLNRAPGTIVVVTKHPPFLVDVFENINTYKINLLPNPCYEKLMLVNLSDTVINDRSMIIYNYLGITMLSYDLPFGTNNFEIDISSLNEGIYFIKINNNLLKFIKLR